MFRTGVLEDAYNNNSITPEGIHRVVTRFPLEPNGFLHLSHIKAIMIDFRFAGYHRGGCSLRFANTNPSGEEEKLFFAIKWIMSWLLGRIQALLQVTSSSYNIQRS